jgi:protein SCO1/2
MCAVKSKQGGLAVVTKTTILISLIILTGLALFITGCQALAAYEYKGNLLDPPVPQPDFELTATDGATFRLGDLEGKIALIFFGYTHCPDVCPLTVAKVKTALDGLSETERERVQFIFISVDPARDTPDVLGRYLSNFSPDFMGLTDDFEKIEAVMEPYWAYAEKGKTLEPTHEQTHATNGHAETAPNYLVSHTGRVYLVTPQRELLLTYPFDLNAETLRSDLSYLLSQ